MLRLVTGPFHPTLETRLVHDLRALKSTDLLASLAIIVPSDQLRRSLKRLVILQEKLSLLNVHILSFHQLALHVDRERRTAEGAKSVRHIDLVSDVFFEHLLRHIGQRRMPQTGSLHLSQLPHGAWPALWASLRDLKDATVDSAVAVRAVEEGQFAPEDGEKLKSLFTLYAAVREGSAALGVGSPDDLASLVTPFVPTSPFIRGLHELWYYGSYDLTQTQLTLLESLAATLPVTVYFPVDVQPAYGFARQFLERHLYPIAGTNDTSAPDSVERAGSDAGRVPVSVEVRNAAGVDDELTLVCKQILTLVETHGYRFEEIGVVGRTPVPYQSAVTRIFDQHRIPFTSTAAVLLLREPAIKTLLHLARLKGNDLHRPAVLEVITSPWNRRLTVPQGAVPPRPDLWRLAVHALGITRGEEEWRRLAQLGRLESWAGTGDEFSEDPLDALSIDGPQLRLLWDCVSPLIAGVTSLPESGGYGALTDAFCALAEGHLSIPLSTSDSIDAVAQSEETTNVTEALVGVLAQLRELDRLDVHITWQEWTDTFEEVLERTTYALTPLSQQGVQVLDAMAARGLGFRALFIVGMNEKMFPRYIHEDGFLRDSHRLVLSETLGYKIDQKLQGYGEEALLFELLRASARERLYLSYQRADATGRPLAPSGYLDAIGAVPHAAEPQSLFALPRRWKDRATLPLFVPPLLTREELTISSVLHGRDVVALLNAGGRDGELFSHSLAAQALIESGVPALSAYDGMLTDATTHWNWICERGVSPTALETYARCPFQYFSAQVLDLEAVRQKVSMELSPPAMGQLCHDALRLCYLALIRQGWGAAASSAAVVTAEVTRAVTEAFAAYAMTHGTGYALIWQLAQETVRRVVDATVRFDREAAAASGFIPVECEIDAKGAFPDGTGGDAIPLRGRWDRLDRHPLSGALRVIDYKYRANDRVEAKDRQLLQAAVRAQRLQPPLYALMAVDGSGEYTQSPWPEQVEFVYLLPQGEPAIERASFAAAYWQGPSGPALSRTVQLLVDGIRSGHHFILPDTAHCDHCEFSTACRKAHQPSWWRARRSSLAGALRAVRVEKVARD
ncbi:MAG: exodeoxyribonuclease V subunit gamma [Nitrospira sp.]|nr:exodeoxyribonuclease V subunit gamma [Nitrospira sp.]